MNDVENMVVIFGILIIFISIPTFCLCNCKKNEFIKVNKSKYIEWLIYNDLIKNNKDVKNIII
jgi:hypothetical protein